MPHIGAVDLTSTSTHSALASVPAAIFVLLLVLTRSLSLPLPAQARAALEESKELVKPFLGMDEAEALMNDRAGKSSPNVDEAETHPSIQTFKLEIHLFGSLATLGWLASILSTNPNLKPKAHTQSSPAWYGSIPSSPYWPSHV